MADSDSDLDPLRGVELPDAKRRRSAHGGGTADKDGGGGSDTSSSAAGALQQRAENGRAKAVGEPVVHVLAFGDSLTFGGFGSRSYPAQLEELLNGRSESGRSYRVHNAGICGDSTEGMIERLPEELVDMERAGIRPAWILVLGGTNDLGHMTPEQILRNLAKLRSIAAAAGAKQVAFTIPRDEFGLGPVARVVNRGLLAAAAGSAESGFPLADLTCISEEYLCDGVHFNTAGYAQFAERAWKAMLPALQESVMEVRPVDSK